MSKKKNRNKKRKSCNYNPVQAAEFLAGGYLHLSVFDFVQKAKKEMDIKNSLYSFIAQKGLLKEFESKDWEK